MNLQYEKFKLKPFVVAFATEKPMSHLNRMQTLYFENFWWFENETYSENNTYVQFNSGLIHVWTSLRWMKEFKIKTSLSQVDYI